MPRMLARFVRMAYNDAMSSSPSERHPYSRKPKWLRVSLAQSEQQNKSFQKLRTIMRAKNLHTVCEEAKCPNIHECWGTHATATFMVLGDTCTRRCRFCSVKTGLPRGVDVAEPTNVGKSVAQMGLRHVVITMVNRDDLRDGGARHVVATIAAIRKYAPGCTVEILSSDLMGDRKSVAIMMEGGAEIMSHNLETVRRLTPLVRSRSEYQRSLDFLQMAKEIDVHTVTKSSMMLGLGEHTEEVLCAMDDLLAHGVSILNLGQYLQPTRAHLAVQKWWTPEEFVELRDIALAKGFRYCESGALVRSSYHAGAQYQEFRRNPSGERSHMPGADSHDGRAVNTGERAEGEGVRQARHPLYQDREIAEHLAAAVK